MTSFQQAKMQQLLSCLIQVMILKMLLYSTKRLVIEVSGDARFYENMQRNYENIPTDLKTVSLTGKWTTRTLACPLPSTQF